jgi:excisionase family DNA binding protein
MTMEQLLAPFGLAEQDLVDAVAARLGPTASTGLPADQQALLEAGGLNFDDTDRFAKKAAADIVAEETVLAMSSIGIAEAAVRMGLSASRVRHLVSDGGLFSMRAGRTVLLPAWQFDDAGRPLRGLAVVLAAARPGEHPLAMQAFMTTPQPDLQLDLQGARSKPMTPQQWLSSGGDPQAVADLLASDVW